MAAIDALMAGVEQYLRELPDDEFDALCRECALPLTGRHGGRVPRAARRPRGDSTGAPSNPLPMRRWRRRVRVAARRHSGEWKGAGDDHSRCARRGSTKPLPRRSH